jgi:hypothetical protein
MLLFNDPRLMTPMHTAWSELGSLIDPESKTGNLLAFIQPLYNFFKIADGVLSKFHDADAFDFAKGSYCEALELLSVPVAAKTAYLNNQGAVVAKASAPDEEPVNADEARLTDDLVAAKSLVLQRLGAMVHLVGTLQYLPDSCVVDLIDWQKVTKGDDKLLPQREVEMALITTTPQVTAIKQNIWQQTAAAKVRSKIVG